MTTYTVRWLDTTQPDPIQSRTFDHIDIMRGFIRAKNRQAERNMETEGPVDWLGYTQTTFDHIGQDDAIFMEAGL